MGPQLSESRVTLLVVDPDTDGGLADQLAAASGSLLVRSVADADSARAALADGGVDCVLCRHEPPAADATPLLAAVAGDHADVPVLVAAPPEDIRAALEAGATDVVALTDEGIDPGVVANRVEIAVSAVGDRMRTLLDALSTAAPEYAFVYGSDGRYLDVFTGRREGESSPARPALLDRSVEEILGPDAAATITDGIDAALAGEEVVTVEYTLASEDGTRWFEGRIVPLSERYHDREAVLLAARETTERERRQRELEETGDRLSRTLERVDDAFFALDDDWRVTYVNSAGAEVLRGAMNADYDDDDLLGRHLWAEIPEAVGTTFYEEYHRAMEAQAPVTFEAEYEPMGVWFEVRAYPDEDGLSVYFTDVTGRKQREVVLDELLAATQQFHRAGGVDELIEAVIGAAEAVFGYEHTAVRLYDPETETLRPVQLSDRTRERIDGLETYDLDEGVSGTVFREGEPRVVGDLSARPEIDYGPFESAIVLPLGDHGTMSIGSTEPEAFGHADAALVELLAVAATAAFDRLERESEMRALQQIIDHVDEMVFLLDGEGRFSFVSSQLATYLGVDRESLVGEPFSTVVAPTDTWSAMTALEEVTGTGGRRNIRIEAAAETDPGATRPVEFELSAVADADGSDVAGVATDISELAATRDDLATERDRFQELFRNLPDPVVELAYHEGCPVVQYANPAFESVFGHDPATIQGENLNDYIVPADEQEAARELDRRTVAGERFGAEIRRTTTDGLRDFLLRVIPYSRGGEQYAFGVYTDISEQIERERYLQVLNRVLRHNLRNDLNVVTAMADLLADKLEDEELSGHAERLRDNAFRVASLSEKAKRIEQVLGKRVDDSAVVDIVPLLERTVAHCRPADATIELDLPDQLRVRADSDVERVAEELIENAIDHADTDEPRIRVEAGPAPDRDGWVELRIHDDGPGIPDQEWRVVSGDVEITQLSHASGLGLWLARWLVEAYGGELRREQRPDGTTVVVALRRAAD